MKMIIPEFSVVALVGISGSGKSTFASKYFKPTEVISSDFCRGLVSDDENDLAATNDAFAVLHFIAGKRLENKKLTVIDATNVQQEARKPILGLAREHHCISVAIVLNIPEKQCQERNRERPDRDLPNRVLRSQSRQLKRSLRSLKREGFRYVYVLDSEEKADSVEIVRQKLWNDKSDDTGPFDIIGDVHGCYDELRHLLSDLGYDVDENLVRTENSAVSHPEGRRVIFVGDLVDRGPKSDDVLALAMNMVANGNALGVPGNHDIKFMNFLKGKKVQINHGLQETIAQFEEAPQESKDEVRNFIDGLVSHYVLDYGKLVVAHAGMKESLQGRASGKVRQFALFGETTGETDEFGLPVRYNWAEEYRGKAMMVYGHTPQPEAEWLNNTVCLDTGCVFGGKLTALRYPERELVSVPALKEYYEPVRPLEAVEPGGVSVQQAYDDLLVAEDIRGKRIVSTRLRKNITIREENSTAALEVMSRFAVNPKWLMYLPPTMSPSETSRRKDLLEHPDEAFEYYRKNGVAKVVCEEKHMGSRAVITICKDEDIARQRFGVTGEGLGVCYTRTGRPFFGDEKFGKEVLNRISKSFDSADFWNKFETDWVCLDTEIMPWSMKAVELLKQQYAAVGAAASRSLADSLSVLKKSDSTLDGITDLVTRFEEKAHIVEDYRKAYNNYCWTFSGIDDLRIAPFHILATEGNVHSDKPHTWHMESIKDFCLEDPDFLMITPYRLVELNDTESVAHAVAWWEDLTKSGGEGMVVKPEDFVAHGKKGLLQPAVKCRGREYLRIIYGPEYTLPDNLSRLRKRGLSRKRSLALREFALGLEAMERFVKREPLRRIHECVFGVLALESEPVDPRL